MFLVSSVPSQKLFSQLCPEADARFFLSSVPSPKVVQSPVSTSVIVPAARGRNSGIRQVVFNGRESSLSTQTRLMVGWREAIVKIHSLGGVFCSPNGLTVDRCSQQGDQTQSRHCRLSMKVHLTSERKLVVAQTDSQPSTIFKTNRT